MNWYGTFINKDQEDVWLVYPWEDWWQRDAVENPVIDQIFANI